MDTIVEAASYAQYYTFSEKLMAVGFSVDTSEGAPTCRWVKGNTVLDVMPLDKDVLGFTNTWYKPVMINAYDHELQSGLTIKVITPPYFCATKFEAFENRGNGDFLASHDLEDIITVIDGRSEIIGEIDRASEDVRNYIAVQIEMLLKKRQFCDALPGFLLPDYASQERVKLLTDRLNAIANFAD